MKSLIIFVIYVACTAVLFVFAKSRLPENCNIDDFKHIAMDKLNLVSKKQLQELQEELERKDNEIMALKKKLTEPSNATEKIVVQEKSRPDIEDTQADELDHMVEIDRHNERILQAVLN